MKIITVIGARPQFIKAAVVSKAIKAQSNLSEIIVHTGQHFDENMSDVFFNQLDIPRPHYQLDINGSTHGDMTGRMLIEIEKILLSEKPDMLLVYGDTNSTLAGALAAAKLHVPVVHVEAGLRSFNMQMPEEINRILTDRVSHILFCPTQAAVDNLLNEGYALGNDAVRVHNIGDVMQDSALMFKASATKPDALPHDDGFVLCTMHRAENTDDPARLVDIVSALNHLHANVMPVVLPLHPRTRALLAKYGLKLDVTVLEPAGYLEMLWLLDNAAMVVTDSGGLQKEAFFFAKPCVTMRDQTEWVELIEAGANVLAGANKDAIINAVKTMKDKVISDPNQLYGGGTASQKIAQYLASYESVSAAA